MMTKFYVRGLFVAALAFSARAEKPDPAAVPVAAAPAVELAWHDVTAWGVEGRAWDDQQRLRYFDRLPVAAKEEGSKILDFYGKFSLWDLSRCSAGMMVRFRSDATAFHVRYRLLNADLALPHMPATGMSGVDLYARDDSGRWRYVQGNKPTSQEVNGELISGLAPGSREYALYLPLYNGVEFLEIGVPKGASFAGLAPRPKPIVFYGTSITQGGVASRPGICHTAIIGRRLDRPVLNLGFSGTGRMDPVMGRFMAQVDAAVYVIECSGNMQPAQIRERCIPLVKQLRAVRLDTPIVLVEDRGFPNAWIVPAKADYNRDNNAALRECFEKLTQERVPALYYVHGGALYGTDSEGSTDNAHANDLGFARMAGVMEPVIRKALGQKSE
jgi:hypothetical protein